MAVAIPTILFAQAVTIQATVDRNRVGLNERFIYTVEVSGSSTSLPEPKFPSMEDFSVLSGPNTSTNIQFINGAMSSSHRYSFFLMPQKEGEFTIEPATIDKDGEILSSNTIKMKVSRTAAKPQQKEPQIKSKNDQDLLGENLYLKTFVNKKSVYQNEQILVEYNLYFRVNVRSYNIEKIPPNPGFWMEEFKITSQPTVSREIINGITYQVATLRKVALFPTRSGDLTIEPMIISVDALVKAKKRSRSLFDNFFDDPFGRTVKKTLNGRSVNITVKALPTKDRPSDFNGVVGNYQISANADVKELKANEAVSVKLTIRGEGNLKLVKPPELKLPPDMEVYEPREKTDISAKNDKITGTKTVEYVIVPRLKGEYKIDPVSLSYFDPRRGKYLRTSTKPILLNVLPGDETGAGLLAGSSLSKQEVALLGQDIRYIKESAEFYLSGQQLYANWLYLFIYLIPVIGLVITWRYNMHRTKMRGNIQLARRRKAGKIASKHLTLAKSQLKSNDKEAFYRATTDALQGFVCDRLNVQISDFSSVQVEKDLERAGLGRQDIEEYLSCLLESDFSRYSGSQAEVGEMESFYQRVKKNLTRLEKYI
ncbi:hypothetical protein ES705_13765 [subsurface metagenome]